jgi:hypothetical protein
MLFLNSLYYYCYIGYFDDNYYYVIDGENYYYNYFDDQKYLLIMEEFITINIFNIRNL